MPDSPLRIAIVRQRYTAFGGAERFTDRALQALTDGGAQVSVLARKWEGEGQFPVQSCTPFYLGRTWRDKSFARCVCDTVAKGDFDLIQSHERIACCDIYRAGDGLHREWLRQRARVASPLTRLGFRISPYHRYVLDAEQRLFTSSRLKAVICNSALIRDEIKSHFPLHDEQLPVLYNGVDTDAFHPRLRDQHRKKIRMGLGAAKDTPVFLFVGSGFLRKGLAAAIDALKRHPSAELWVVGKDKHRQDYEKLAAPMAPRVRFLGPKKDVKPYYGAADALLLPTLYDPFPNVVLEAMACGLPVITSLKCGAVDIIEDGNNGFICDALDIPGLSHRMSQVSDPAVATRVGLRGRDTVADWTLERVAQQAMQLYAELTS